MLLTDFDENKTALINASMFYEKMEKMPKTAVSIFSKTVLKNLVEIFNPELITTIRNAAMEFPVYKIVVDEVELALYQSPVGAPACVGCFEELIALGVENLLLTGTCGCLESSIKDYSIIIPESAIRDEGTSYHYLPVSDEIKLNDKCVKLIEEFMKNKNIEYIKGKTWTTDAFYRETVGKIDKRKQQGAISVEMECSAMVAVAEFRKINFGQFLYAADNLANEEYDPRTLLKVGLTDSKKKIGLLLIECGKYLDENLK